MNLSSWRRRSVFVTGHTGFKGGWLTAWLKHAGASVTGYSLEPADRPNLFEAAAIDRGIESVIGDIRDSPRLAGALRAAAPEVVFHLAAQPLVGVGYADPLETLSTNIMGTANLLDAVRAVPSVRAVVVVTTDKCYEDRNWPWPYRETDRLGGHDPYAASKACAELVTSTYRDAFLASHGIGVATARAGNVIGGGDWARDRILPDIARACSSGLPVRLRNPHAIRPWQHVLDALAGYLMLADQLLVAPDRFGEGWNFGPDEHDCVTVADFTRRAVKLWGSGSVEVSDAACATESATLRLDSSKARLRLGWAPRLPIDVAQKWAVDWYKSMLSGSDARTLVDTQIQRFEETEACQRAASAMTS